MRKKIIGHCLFGAPAGLSLYVMFTLWASWLRGGGKYYFTSGHLVLVYGNEVNAVTAACASAMFIGMIWSAASLIYQETDWSLMKQTVVHCLVCVAPSLLIAYLMFWMPRNLDGLMQYLTVFGGMYVMNWIGQYLGMKRRVKQLNEKLSALTGE